MHHPPLSAQEHQENLLPRPIYRYCRQSLRNACCRYKRQNEYDGESLTTLRRGLADESFALRGMTAGERRAAVAFGLGGTPEACGQRAEQMTFFEMLRAISVVQLIKVDFHVP